jgi:hypothetical protein
MRVDGANQRKAWVEGSHCVISESYGGAKNFRNGTVDGTGTGPVCTPRAKPN